MIAKTRNAKSGEWGRLLEWSDDDNVMHQWAMPLDLLEGDGVGGRPQGIGANGPAHRHHSGCEGTAGRVHQGVARGHAGAIVERLGWHGGVYTIPAETIGEAGEIVVFQNAHAVEPAFEVAGNLDSWRDSVGALATGNTRLVFAVSVAFAGTLTSIVGEDSGGFHLRGKSSTGKSTASKAAASVWGDPLSYMRSWRATSNGLEGMAALHNDGCLILDELSACDPKQAGETTYMLANGQGKARANQRGAARASQRWRLLFLSNGEVSLSALMAQADRRVNTGQEVRLADFDADAGQDWAPSRNCMVNPAAQRCRSQ